VDVADLHHVLHLDALDGLALGVESVDAEEGPILFADPKTNGGEGTIISGAWLGFKNVGVQGFDGVGAQRLDIVPLIERRYDDGQLGALGQRPHVRMHDPGFGDAGDPII